MQDNFRYSHDENNKTKLCKEIIVENDRRFRIKNKINSLANSNLREQKGYNLRKAYIVTHQGLGDNITAIGMVRYLSTCYDQVIVPCKRKNYDNLKLFYEDDPTIVLEPFDDEFSTLNKQKLDDKKKTMNLYVCGCHNGFTNFNELPFCFYSNVNIDHQFFWNYFYVPIYKYCELHNEVKNLEYVFVHNFGSQGKVFDDKYVTDKLGLDKNNILFVNPNENMYTIGHKFYEIANKFVGKLLIHYANVIINAKYVILTDSSFFCMALNLDMNTNECYYVSRNNKNYDYLYNAEYIFDKKLKRRIFTKL